LKVAGTYTFSASREEVWSAINDPEVLARAIPGCQRLDQVGEHEFESTLKVGLQAVKGVYNGRVTLSNHQAPSHYEILIDGKGSNGFLKGTGAIDLEEAGENKTLLKYKGEAQIGGTIASVGQRLIDGASKTLINQSLKALAQQIELRKQGGQASEEPAAAEPVAAEEPAAKAAPNATTTTMSASSAASAASDSATDTASQNSSADAKASPAPDAGEQNAPNTFETITDPAAKEAETNAASAVVEAAAEAPAAVPAAPSTSGFQARTIVVPESEQLSESSVVQGMVSDFVKERPWVPWVVIAFLLGILLGRRNA
jgi:carbon monoxide dehydrogenase subunit G